MADPHADSEWRPSPRRAPKIAKGTDAYADVLGGALAALEALPSRASRGLLSKVRRLARLTSFPVLFEGESGVGKTFFARAIHELSPRATKTFVASDLTTMRGDLAVSALFGHERGAYTGANARRAGAFRSANEGTLFLDELGKAELGVQALLLRAVEDGFIQPLGSDRTLPVDVRCVFATNLPLTEGVKKEILLPDLAARLRSFMIRIAPIRERMDDVPHFVERALLKAARELSLEKPPTISPELQDILLRHRWPDNVREIFGTIGRIMADADGAKVLLPSHIPDECLISAVRGRRRKPRLVRGAANEALKAAKGNKSEAARIAQCHRMTIYRHLKKDQDP